MTGQFTNSRHVDESTTLYNFIILIMYRNESTKITDKKEKMKRTKKLRFPMRSEKRDV